jgi:hypothetical protein
MSNWSVTSNTFAALAGSSISNQEVELTINPLNGCLLSASNFQIGGATEINDLLVPTSGTGIWQGGNVDEGVVKVKFEDNGTPNTGNNTIKVTVTLNNINAPSSSTTYNIDIDEVASNPVTDIELRHFCFTYVFDYLPIGCTGCLPDPNPADPADPSLAFNPDFGAAGNPTMTLVSSSNPGSTTTNIAWEYNNQTSAGTPYASSAEYSITNDNSFILGGQWNTVGSITIAADGDNYFTDLPTSSELSSNAFADGVGTVALYQPYFETEVTGDVYNSDGNLTQWTITYKYHPPNDPPLYPDPTDGQGNSLMCDFGMKTEIDYNLVIVI